MLFDGDSCSCFPPAIGAARRRGAQSGGVFGPLARGPAGGKGGPHKAWKHGPIRLVWDYRRLLAARGPWFPCDFSVLGDSNGPAQGPWPETGPERDPGPRRFGRDWSGEGPSGFGLKILVPLGTNFRGPDREWPGSPVRTRTGRAGPGPASVRGPWAGTIHPAFFRFLEFPGAALQRQSEKTSSTEKICLGGFPSREFPGGPAPGRRRRPVGARICPRPGAKSAAGRPFPPPDGRTGLSSSPFLFAPSGLFFRWRRIFSAQGPGGFHRATDQRPVSVFPNFRPVPRDPRAKAFFPLSEGGWPAQSEGRARPTAGFPLFPFPPTPENSGWSLRRQAPAGHFPPSGAIPRQPAREFRGTRNGFLSESSPGPRPLPRRPSLGFDSRKP